MSIAFFKPLNLLGLAPFALLLIASASHAQVIEQTFDARSGGHLTLDTDIGTIHIKSHSDAQVLVKVRIEGADEGDMAVTFDANDGDVAIEGKLKGSGWGSGWGSSRGLRVSYDITVPQNYNLNLDTSGGSIDIQDLIGNVDANTSGGSISLGHIDGEVDVDTSGGSIDVDAVSGNLNAHTSGGSIRARLDKQPTGDNELSTSGGSIKVYLFAEIKVDLSASTSGGRVKTDFDVDGRVDKQKIRGTINGGGPRLRLSTSGGSVRINQL